MNSNLEFLFAREPVDEAGALFALLDEDPWTVNWPQLSCLPLSEAQISERRLGIGGSDVNVLMGGDGAAIIALWEEKRGVREPEDLAGKLPVMLGSWTEEFNRQWCERLRGKAISSRGLALSCPTHPWRRCTLDGLVAHDGAIWEGKHTNAFTNPDDILERYMPQLQHNMAVAQTDRAVLSVIFGNHKFEILEIASDWVYQLELLEAEIDFWDCVQTGRMPVPPNPPASPRPVGVREVCLHGNNLWATAADDWAKNREAAKIHAGACSQLKALVEPDVSRAFGHGIEAKRSKSGAISIRELAS